MAWYYYVSIPTKYDKHDVWVWENGHERFQYEEAIKSQITTRIAAATFIYPNYKTIISCILLI